MLQWVWRPTDQPLVSLIMNYDFNSAAVATAESLEAFAIESAPLPELVAMSLTDLSPGDEAIVVDLHETGPIGRRLLDLGLLPNTRIKMVRRAPLGDPILFELRGYRLCLRGADAARVRVAPAPAGDSIHAARP